MSKVKIKSSAEGIRIYETSKSINLSPSLGKKLERKLGAYLVLKFNKGFLRDFCTLVKKIGSEILDDNFND